MDGWIGWMDGSLGLVEYRAPYGANNHLIGVILPQTPLQLTQIIEDLRVLS